MNKMLGGLVSDIRGQDMIEYALMAGFVAVAAGAVMPGVANAIDGVLAKASATLSGSTTAVSLVSNETGMIRIVCAILAALFLALIVMRRKNTVE